MTIKDKLISLRKELGRLLFEMEEVGDGVLRDKDGKLFKFNEQGQVEPIVDLIPEPTEPITEPVEVEPTTEPVEDLELITEPAVEPVIEEPVINEELETIKTDYSTLKNEYDESVSKYEQEIRDYKVEIKRLKKEIEKLLAEPLQAPADVEIKQTNKAVINKNNFKAAEFFH